MSVVKWPPLVISADGRDVLFGIVTTSVATDKVQTNACRSRTPVPRKHRRIPSSDTVTWETVREIVRHLPGCEEGTSYGTPAFKVRGKLFVRLHQTEPSIVVRIEEADRTMRMQADPAAFYITDHYAPYPWMLVRLSAVSRDDLADLLEESWRLRAPQRLLAEYNRE
jgi:hypothetical protein